MFKEQARSGKARVGWLMFQDYSVETPIFMPVATRGAFKGVPTIESVVDKYFDLILCNSWHLWLRPGIEVIEKSGGLHKFISWQKKILTDSGGFQIFSLARQVKYSDSGVEFISPYDGKRVYLTPELAIENQVRMGVDIAMLLDVCSAKPTDRVSVENEMALTHRWAQISASRIDSLPHAHTKFFGIVQGGVFEDLRTISAQFISQFGFDGVAVGGLAVGERKSLTYRMLKLLSDQLPENKPRYVMGLGLPLDLLVAVKFGYDMFDCVLPTRAARFGRAYVNSDHLWLNIKNSEFINDQAPIDYDCPCFTCKNYSRAYLNHLFRVDEMLGGVLLTYHNLTYYYQLMKRIRESIRLNEYDRFFKNQFHAWLRCEKFVSIIGSSEVDEICGIVQ